MTAVLLALVAGAVVGLALGGLGGGGSMLAVPALIYLLGLTPGTATTASLLIVAATSLTGLLAHARAGRVRWRTGLLFAAAGLPLAALGGALSRHLPAPALTAAFALLAALAAWRMLSAGRSSRPAVDQPASTSTGQTENAFPLVTDGRVSAPTRRAASAFPSAADQAATTPAERTASAFPLAADATPPPRAAAVLERSAVAPSNAAIVAPEPHNIDDASPAPALAPPLVSARRSALAGAGLGAATGVLGVGGGLLAVPALVAFLAFPMAEAIGTSLLVITLNSLAALLPRLDGAAGIPWGVVGPFTAAAILGAWDGKRLASKLSVRTLQRIFAGALLAVAALMLLDAAT
ncbi:TSUP family transporter [Kitasatospora sp. NPDC088134]|uniref:TSUP family transporter n=1 Tax=Kitasatospora sp. NPDC088134 TaxID=3364071 RepID=UPI00381C08B9